MSNTKSGPKKKAEVSLVRSSAAEYLTFVAAGGDSEASVEMRYEDENIWLTQKMRECEQRCAEAGIRFTFTIHPADFIEEMSTRLAGDLFATQP